MEYLYRTDSEGDLFQADSFHKKRKGRRGTACLLYIDQHILKNWKRDENCTFRVDRLINGLWYSPAILDKDSLKMYKISDKVIKFITEDMKNRKVELTSRETILAEVKIQRGVFQGYARLPLICVIMPLNYIFRKCIKFTKSQEKLNHLMNMDDIKLFAKNNNWKHTYKHYIYIYIYNANYMCREEKEKDNYLVLKIAWIHQYKNSETLKRGISIITAVNNSSNNITRNRTREPKNQKWEEKELYAYFKQQIGKMLHEKTWT